MFGSKAFSDVAMERGWGERDNPLLHHMDKRLNFMSYSLPNHNFSDEMGENGEFHTLVCVWEVEKEQAIGM